MTASSHATTTHPPVPPTLTDYHISSSFIDDSFCKKCQAHQSRPFLSGGIRPTVGQRVEVLMFLKRKREDGSYAEMGEGETWEVHNMEEKVRPFRLSGEVVEVRERPSLESPPQPALDNRRRTRSQTRRITLDQSDQNSTNNKDDTNKSMPQAPPMGECNTPTSTPAGQRFRPATSPEDSGPGFGSLLLADIIKNQQPGNIRLDHMADPTPQMLDHWNAMSMEDRERIYDFMVGRWGAVHGQEIVCEARLNFDYDIRRGNENGPWADLIPVDGRDIWRFTMTYNDQYDDDAWHAIPSSFQNMGRHHRNRCWPWTDDHSLPYRRTGADAPVWGNGPGGALQVHVDLGPFLERNVGRKRPNSLQAYAA